MSSQSDWKQRLLAELRRDKKKTAILSLLLVAGLVVGARQASKLLGPSQAQASAGSALLYPSGKADSVPAAAGAAEQDRKGAYIRQADRQITRDVFAVRLDLFAPDETVEPVKVTPASAPSVDEEQAKTRRVANQAQILALQSTVTGENATAVINGNVLRVGEQVHEFRILEIQDQSCVIEKDGVKLTLTMRE